MSPKQDQVGAAADGRPGTKVLEERALAKINLTLKVTARASSGYHLIDSLVTFADVGERVTAIVGERGPLRVSGPMAGGLTGEANLILKTDRAFREVFPDVPPVRYRLDKQIPVAAGLGGGSCDAACALRLLAKLCDLDPRQGEIAQIGIGVGADVPVCIDSESARVSGIGEEVERLANMPRFALVLVNPGVALETRRVFEALALKPGQRFGEPMHGEVRDERKALERAVISGGNDLEPPARCLVPLIGEVLEAIGQSGGCVAARMSGSGATCFGIYEDMECARRAARTLERSRPGWWIRPVLSGGLAAAGLSESG